MMDDYAVKCLQRSVQELVIEVTVLKKEQRQTDIYLSDLNKRLRELESEKL